MNFIKILFLLSIIMCCTTRVYAEHNSAEEQNSIAINGTVMDKERIPLVGVIIRIKGADVNTNTATTTDVDGNFFFNAPSKNTVLEITYLGFKTQEITVGNKIHFDIILEEDMTNLNEIMVTGYGHQKKVSVIGSIETIDPKNIEVGSTRSVSNNLAGQIAGVIAVQRSGEPGYDNSNFWIRGISSFSGNQNPLILIDGVERDLNNIDPAEIESFSVLKDASASAMYGVRGANGVIIVNTKRGQIGAPKVEIKVEQSISQPTKLPDFIGAAEHMKLLNEVTENKSRLPYAEDRIYKTQTGYDRDLYPDVNWVDEITKDYAYSTRANLTVSGGSDFLRYSLVGSYFGEKGILETDNMLAYDTGINLDRYNMRANVDLDVTQTTTLRMNIGGYLQQHRSPNASTDEAFSKAFLASPFIHPIRYSDGKIPTFSHNQGISNPWAFATQQGYMTTSQSQIQSLFAVEQDLDVITKGLKAKVTFSFDSYSWGRMIRGMNQTLYNVATTRDIEGNLEHTVQRYGDESLGHAEQSDYGNTRVYFEATASYNRVFNAVHNVDALFLYNQQSYDDGSFQPYRRQGLAGRLSYTYDNRYVAEFNFGYNGSENFEKGKRFGFFPSAAIGWIISEESFIKNNFDTLSKLKIRASVGKAGNDNIGGRRFAYMTTINEGAGGYDWGSNSQISRPGITEGEIGVSNLTWETAIKYNLGLEIGLWNELNLNADIFKEQRRDIFMQRTSIPTQSGIISSPWANFGKVDNQGIEFSLSYNKSITRDLQLNLRSTFTYAKNKVIEYDEPESVKGTHQALTGLSLNTIDGLIAERLFTQEDFDAEGNLIDGLPIHELGSTVRPGDIKYIDRTGDDIINEEDAGFIGGTNDPQIIYGFGGTLNYKNLDFNFFFQGVGKTERMIGGSNYFIPGSGQGVQGNIYANYNDRWTETNPAQNVFWPRLSEMPNQHNYRASTWWKKDMSFLRCKLIELGYTLPSHITDKVKLSDTRFYVSGNNLFYFSKFKLWDPELDTTNGLKYPPMRSILLGVVVNF